ncbi:hypothetical protein SBV1_2130009 [Verrucomicrobia bacterium]|nr:hypothetical protein SBV1_2130009 [Verrucomicrobiota bacterium]
MSNDAVFDAFLAKQLEEGLAWAKNIGVLSLSPIPGAPPSRYVAHFVDCKGLVQQNDGRIVEFDQFMVGIYFPEDYLRHVEIPRVLTYLGPHPSPFHPNIRPPFLCAHLVPGTSLVDILYACYEVWTYSIFSAADSLNPAAAQWSRQQDRKRFPIDRRPLKRSPRRTNLTPMEAK